jgi:O-antigen ligase
MFRHAAFYLIAATTLLAPWFFGAWEMWWFWLFAFLLFAAAACYGLHLLIGSFRPAPATPAPAPPHPITPYGRSLRIAIGLTVPFLAYATVRAFQVEVALSAERALLLFVTPLLLGLCVVFGFTPNQTRRLHLWLAVDLLLLGLYGALNHWIAGSRHVLWAPGYEQYTAEHRATGSYFCPDHFSGAMELGLAVGLGLLLPRGQTPRRRALGGALAVVALVGIALSKSRGGGLTALVILALAIAWGFDQWPLFKRWSYRVSAASLAGIALLVFLNAGTGYMARFHHEFGWHRLRGRPPRQAAAAFLNHMAATSRGRMIGGALRAWSEHKWLGVGPGMHQNLWPHYAATRDGDRDQRRWPTQTNHDFHSYEVHSDWVQALEEYGLIGAGLLLLPVLAILRLLRRALKFGIRGRRERHWTHPPTDFHPAALAAWFGFGALLFHSLGDFNLQMPATVWLLAALVAMPIARARTHVPAPRRRRRRSRFSLAMPPPVPAPASAP